MDVSEVLRACRMQSGMTLNALAKKTGIQAPTISRWERGKAEPTVYNFEVLLNAMGFSLEMKVGILE